MASKKKQPPSLDEIQQLRKDGMEYWGARQERNKLNSEVYHNEHEIEPPPAGEQIILEPQEMRSGRGGELCDHAKGILDVQVQYSVDAPGKRAEDVETWMNLIRPTAEREQGEDTNSAVTGESVVLGYSAVKIFPNPTYWKGKYPKQDIDRDGKKIEDEPDEDYNKRQIDFGHTAPIPIAIWHVPVSSWYPLLNGRSVIKSLECKEVTPAYIEARYGEKFDEIERKKIRETKELELIEYVDDTYCAWYCRAGDLQKELRVWEHKMPLPEGQAPVVLIPLFTTHDTAPEYRFKGLLEDVRDSIVGQDLVLSRSLTAVVLYYWLTVIHKIKRGPGMDTLDEIKKKRKFTLGGTNFVLDNEELNIMGLPSQLPDAEGLYDKLETRIARSFPPILSGDVSGISSGYEFDIARRTALTRVKPGGSNMAQGDADIMRMIFYALGGLAKILKKDNLMVYVRQTTEDGVKPIGVSWEMVRDFIPLVRAKREEEFPEDIHSKIDATIKAWKELNLPWAYCIENIFGAQNPEELKELRDVENIVDSPTVLERTEQDVFREMDLILDEQEGMAPEEINPEEIPPGLAGALGLAPEPMTEALDVRGTTLTAPPLTAGNGASPNVQTTNPRAGTKTQNRGRRRRGGRGMKPQESR